MAMMDEDKSDITSAKKERDAATPLLRRVNWAPGRYTDNIGIQFILELKRLGDAQDGNGHRAVNEFIADISHSPDMYRTPFNALQQRALQQVAARCNIEQQLRDSQMTSNARSALLSRRAVIGGAGGAAAGYIVGNILGRYSPENNEELRAAQDKMSALRKTSDAFAQREEKLAPALGKADGTMTPEENKAVVELARDKLRYNRKGREVQKEFDDAVSPMKTLLPLLQWAEYLAPALGVAGGMYASTLGEMTEQSAKKFEASVKSLDALINYRLGRTGHAPSAQDMSR